MVVILNNYETMAKQQLKGGLSVDESPFAALYEMVQNKDDAFQFKQIVERAAKNLADQQLIRSAAYNAKYNNWVAFSDAEYQWSTTSDLALTFADHIERTMFFRKELQESQELIPAVRVNVKIALYDLIELMGRWYVSLTKKDTRRNRTWEASKNAFYAMHKDLKRRFTEYRQWLGKTDPVIE